MLNNLKYVVGIILFVVFMWATKSANANELNRLLEGKQTEYVGTCRFDKNDMLIFKDEADMRLVKCVVGVEPPDMDTKFVMLLDDTGPVVLLEYSMTRNAQRKVWNRGAL